MEEEVDEFGIPIKKAAEVDEFGIPVKKKENSTLGTFGPPSGESSAQSSDPILQHIRENKKSARAAEPSPAPTDEQASQPTDPRQEIALRKGKVAQAFAQSYADKYKPQYQIDPQYAEDLSNFVKKESETAQGIAQKQLETWVKARQKELTDSGMTPEDASALIQIESKDKIKGINDFQSSILQQSYDNKLAELHALTAEKESAKRIAQKDDAGFWQSLTHKINDVFLNQLPKDVYLNHMMQLPSSYGDALKEEKWASRLNGLDFKKPIDELIEGYSKAKEPDFFQKYLSLNNAKETFTAIGNLRKPELKNVPDKLRQGVIYDALVQTKKELGDATSDPVLTKQTFAEKFNRAVEKQKAKEWQSAQVQGDESAKYLEGIPSSWEDAKNANNISSYLAGAVGNAVGSSAVGLGIPVSGVYMMESGEAYDSYVKAKAQQLSHAYGTQITPEQVVLAGEDKDAVDIAQNVGMINGALENVGYIFGAGKLAANVLSKKVVDQAVKKGLGKQLVSFGKNLGGAVIGEGGTETLQAINTIVGKKMVEGKTIDEALASFDDKDIDEVLESGRQGAIGGAFFGGGSATHEAVRQTQTNNTIAKVEGLVNAVKPDLKVQAQLDALEKSGDLKRVDGKVEIETLEGAKKVADVMVNASKEDIKTGDQLLNHALAKTGFKGIPKITLEKQVNKLVEQGKIAKQDGRYEIQDPVTAKQISEKVTQTAAYLPKYHPVQKMTSEYRANNPVENVSTVPVRDKAVALPESAAIEGAGLNLDAVAKTHSNPDTRRAAKALTNVKKALGNIAPGVRTVFFQDDKAGVDTLRALGYQVEDGKKMNGFYDPENKIIAINVNDSESNTPFHEGIHPVIAALEQNQPQVFDDFAKEAAALPHPDGKTYGEVMGSPREALTEVLADVADGKFDNKGTLLDKAVRFINHILTKIGYGPIRKHLGTENLKAFANDLAHAIKQGRPAAIKESGQNQDKAVPISDESTDVDQSVSVLPEFQDRKLNKTAKRVAADAFTELKFIQSQILTNPDAYSYDPQSITKAKADFNHMTLPDLVAAQTNEALNRVMGKNTEFSVLAAIELLKRYQAAGNEQEANNVFKTLRETGTNIGQLLRQFGELKTTPQGIQNVIEGNLRSMGLFLTPDQQKECAKLTNAYNAASVARNTQRTNYLSNPTEMNRKRLEVLNDKAATAFQDLGTFAGRVTPFGIENFLNVVLQGNLLVPKSIVTNVVGNVINPTKYIEHGVGALSAYAVNRIKGKNPVSAVEMFWGNTLNSVIAFGKALYAAPIEAVKGKASRSEILESLEVRSNLAPLTAMRQLFIKGLLPVNEKGKVPFMLKTEKAMEATLGINPAVMFRLLEVGDKPFRESAKIAALDRVYAEEGGAKKFGSFEQFKNSLSPEQAKRVDKMTNEVIFSDEGELYKQVQKYLVPLLNKGIPSLTGWVPVIGPLLEIGTRVMLKTALPYVKIPSNLLQRSMEYALPAIPAARAVRAYRAGDPRTGGEMVARTIIGASMWYALDMLYAAGVIVAGSADDKDQVRALKYEGGGPNTVNTTAFMRLINGTQDPANPAQPGDNYIDLSRWGILGIVGSIRSEVNESLKKAKNPGLTELSEHPMNWLGAQFNGMIKGSLDISFLQQAMNMFEEYGKNGVTGITTEMLGSASAILLPNNFMMYTKSKAPYTLRAKDEDALTELQEKMSIKLFPNQKDGATSVYPIIGMFGTPVQQTPEGKNALVYQFFDISKSRTVDDPFIVELLNLYSGGDRLKPEQLPISAPTPDIELPVNKSGSFSLGDDAELKDYKAEEQDWVYMQMLAGRYKKFMINTVRDSGEWAAANDIEKNKILQTINERVNKAAKLFVRNNIIQGLIDGNVSLHDGRYRYADKPAFDYQYFEKHKAEFDEQEAEDEEP